jgi:hypothetical protein
MIYLGIVIAIRTISPGMGAKDNDLPIWGLGGGVTYGVSSHPVGKGLPAHASVALTSNEPQKAPPAWE